VHSVTPPVAPVVIDNGSGFIKAGFSGPDGPCAVFPSVVGRPRQVRGQLCVSGLEERRWVDDKDRFIGAEALSHRDLLTLKNPIERGVIVDWDDMETIWHHVYKELHADPVDHPVLLTEVPLSPKPNKEKTTQVSPELLLTSLVWSGDVRGMVMESGDGCSHVVPVYEGYALPQAVLRLNLGGADLTDYLLNRMFMGLRNVSGQREIVTDMKEKLCFVAQYFDQQVKTAASSSTLDKTYQLPDGREVSIGEERIRCPEALFKPELIGLYQINCEPNKTCRNLAEETENRVKESRRFLTRDLFSLLVSFSSFSLSKL
uniref:Uncharacterized protein n=1 Tax=Poecilia latipinna TaxID=48699 RepID=A0A3B3TNP8_9TELE